MDAHLPTYMLVNPASQSGKGMKIWESLKGRFEAASVRGTVLTSTREVGLGDLARDVTRDGKECNLLVFGGDGTLSEVIAGIPDLGRVNIGCIGTGSSNDFLRSLGQDRPQKAVEAILARKEPVCRDLGEICYLDEEGKERRRVFLVSAGMGFDAACCEMANRSRLKGVLNKIGLGKLVYVACAFRLIAFSHLYPMKVTLERAGGETVVHTFDRPLFAVCMNHPYEGGGFQFCPDADGTDGILDLCVAADIPRPKFFMLLPKAYDGGHVDDKGVVIDRGLSVTIESETPLFFHTDGETTGKTRYLRAELHPLAVRLWN